MAKIGLGAPPMSINDVYLQAILQEWAARTECIKTSHDIRDPRVAMLTKSLITMVADKEVQRSLWEYRDRYYEAALKEYKNITRDDEALARFDADTLALGHLWGWLGEAIPLITQMTYGVCGKQENEEEDEIKYGGGDTGDLSTGLCPTE